MTMRALKMAKELAAQYQRFAEVAGTSIANAWIVPSAGVHAALSSGKTSTSCRVLVKRSQKDIVNNKGRASLQTYQYDITSGEWSGSLPVQLDASVVCVQPSPSGRFIAIIKKEAGDAQAGAGSKSKTICELWSENGSILRSVVADKLHGDPLADGWFGDVSWSPDEKYLCYVAEAAVPYADAKSHFDALKPTPPTSNGAAAAPSSSAGAAGSASGTPTPAAQTNANSAPTGFGKQFDYESGGREDWGEKYVGVRLPRLFIVDWSKGIVVPVAGVSEQLAVGQPVWAPFQPTQGDPSTAASAASPVPKDGSGSSSGGSSKQYWLAYTGWTIGARRLGMIYCHQRPCALYAVNVTQQLQPGTKNSNVTTPKSPADAAATAKVPKPQQHYVLTADQPVSRSPRFSPLSSPAPTTSSSATASMPSARAPVRSSRSTVAALLPSPAENHHAHQHNTPGHSNDHASSSVGTTTVSSSAAAAPGSIKLVYLAMEGVQLSVHNGTSTLRSFDWSKWLRDLDAAAATITDAATAAVIASDAPATPSPQQPTPASIAKDAACPPTIAAHRHQSTSPLADPSAWPRGAYWRTLVPTIWNPWLDADRRIKPPTGANDRLDDCGRDLEATAKAAKAGSVVGATSNITNPSYPAWFPGITTDALPSRSFSADGRFLWLSSAAGSMSVIYRVDTESGDVVLESDATAIVQAAPTPSSTQRAAGIMADDGNQDQTAADVDVDDEGEDGEGSGAAGDIGGNEGHVSTNVFSVATIGDQVLMLAGASCPSQPDNAAILTRSTDSLNHDSSASTAASPGVSPQCSAWESVSPCPLALPSASDLDVLSLSSAEEVDRIASGAEQGDSTDLSFTNNVTTVLNALKTINWRIIKVMPKPRGGKESDNGNDQLPFDAILMYPRPAAPAPAASASAGAIPTASEFEPGTDANVNSLAIKPQGPKPLPLLLCPHGGPHSGFQTSFILPYAYMCSLGYAVCMVNYRGSSGFGSHSIASLPGSCGDNDVSDCYQTVLTALAVGGCADHPIVKEGLTGVNAATAAGIRASLSSQDSSTSPTHAAPLFDIGRVSIQGGSHGGFLTGHLIGQTNGGGSVNDAAVASGANAPAPSSTASPAGSYHSLFRAAVMRNPVTNIPGMTSTSDIPDWCWTETMGADAWPLPVQVELKGVAQVLPAASEGTTASEPAAKIVSARVFADVRYPHTTPAAIAKMWASSPIAHVHNVRIVGASAESDAAIDNTGSNGCSKHGEGYTAVMLMLGMKDRRVPPSQGLEYYHVLKSMVQQAALMDGNCNSSATSPVEGDAGASASSSSPSTAAPSATESIESRLRMLYYPDDVHALDRPATEGDAWVNIAAFLQEHAS